MTRVYREITYTPLSQQLELDAYLAPDPGEWRGHSTKKPCSKARAGMSGVGVMLTIQTSADYEYSEQCRATDRKICF